LIDFFEKRKLKENYFAKRDFDFLDDELLERMSCWYTRYFKESFWELDIKVFMNEYKIFKETRMSRTLYWNSLINFAMLLSRIESCEYDCIKELGSTDVPNKSNKDKYTVNLEGKYIGTFPGIGSVRYMVYRFHKCVWDKHKDEIVSALIYSLDCNYDNLIELYRSFICFCYENDKIKELSQYHDFHYFIKEMCESKGKHVIPPGFVYLSLSLPSMENFARHEFTQFVVSTINPVYKIDNISMGISYIVGHDFSFHALVFRKKTEPQNVDEFIDMIYDKPKFLVCVHYLFHECRSNVPFSYENLKYNYNKCDRQALLGLNEDLLREFGVFCRGFIPDFPNRLS